MQYDKNSHIKLAFLYYTVDRVQSLQSCSTKEAKRLPLYSGYKDQPTARLTEAAMFSRPQEVKPGVYDWSTVHQRSTDLLWSTAQVDDTTNTDTNIKCVFYALPSSR